MFMYISQRVLGMIIKIDKIKYPGWFTQGSSHGELVQLSHVCEPHV